MSDETKVIEMFPRRKAKSDATARRRHPSSQEVTPTLMALRLMRYAVEDAWEVLDATLARPLPPATRKAVADAAVILSTARRVHPAGRSPRLRPQGD